jgi:hypothetical protein
MNLIFYNTQIEEYVEDGQITESGVFCFFAVRMLTHRCMSNPETIRVSPRFESLSSFTTIYGIGPHTARKLLAEGMRTICDLEDRFGGAETDGGVELINRDGQVQDEEIVERSIQVSLTLRNDFSEK